MARYHRESAPAKREKRSARAQDGKELNALCLGAGVEASHKTLKQPQDVAPYA